MLIASGEMLDVSLNSLLREIVRGQTFLNAFDLLG
jgi:hypothetical protein